MFLSMDDRNRLKQVFQPSDFSKLGVDANYIDKNTIKISRGGKPLGQIRKFIGKFVWYAADTGQQQFSEFTPEKMLLKVAKRV